MEMITAAAGIDDLDRGDEVRRKIVSLLAGAGERELITARLAQLLGVTGASAAPEETHWAVRKLFEALAATSPAIIVFEDLHWAEPSLLDLIEHVAYWSRDAPILLVCTARRSCSMIEQPGAGGSSTRPPSCSNRSRKRSAKS
jgi:predicted ATPase